MLAAEACSCAAEPSPDAGTFDAGPDAAVDASSVDTGVDADLDAGPRADAGCSRLTQTVGPEGGTLVHCDGARLEVPPGALAAPTELFIERIASPPGVALPYVLAGPAFQFGPSGAALLAPARFVLPHGGGARMEIAVLVDGAWQGVEVCASDDTTVSQSFGALGSFVALHDPTPYPPGPDGLGTGSIDFTFDGVRRTLPIAYAIDEDVGPGESLALVFRESDGAGSLRQVDLRVGIDTSVTPLQLAYADISDASSVIWDVITILHPGELTVTVTSRMGATLSGNIVATLHSGDQTRSFTGTFTVTPVEWRYPPERACGMPEG